MALKVGELYALFTLNTSDVLSGMEGVSTRLTTLSSQFAQAGTLWSNSISKPLMDFFRSSLRTGMDFKQGMSAVAAIGDIDLNTEEGQRQLEELSEKARQVAKDSIFTVEEMAGAYNKMAMAGWKQESMLAGLEPITDLAAASGGEIVEVSDIVTDAMTAFGLTFENAGHDVGTFNKDITHFTDVLAAAATSSNTNVHMMGESFKYAGSFAGAMNYKIDDIAVALGLMANRGIKASQAGTALRRVLSNILNPSDKVVGAINAVNVSLHKDGEIMDFMQLMTDLREKFKQFEMTVDSVKDNDTFKEQFDIFNNSQAVLAYNKALEETGDETKINTDIMKAYEEQVQILIDSLAGLGNDAPAALQMMQKAAVIAGTRGLPALLAIISSSEEEFNSLADSIYNSEGRTHEMKETMLDTAMGDLEMFQSSVNVLKEEIESLVDGKLRELLQVAKDVVDKFIGMDDATKEGILTIAGLAAAIGPALIGMSLMMKIVPMIGSAMSALVSPMGMVVALFGMMAIAAMDSEGKLTKGLAGISEALGIDVSDFSLNDINVNEMLDGLLGGIEDLAKNPAVTGFMARLGEGLKGALGALGNIVGDIIAYIISPEGMQKIWDAGQALGNLLIEAFKNVLGGITNFFFNLIDRVLVGLGLVDEDAMKTYKQNQGLGERLGQSFIEGFEDTATDLAGEGNYTKAILAAVFGQGLEGAIDRAGNAFKDDLEEKVREVTGDNSFNLPQRIANLWNTDLASSNISSGDDLKKAMAPFLSSLGASVESLPDKVYDQMAEYITKGGIERKNNLLALLIHSLFPDAALSDEEIAAIAADNAKDAAEKIKQQVMDDTMDQLGLNDKESQETANEFAETVASASADAVSGMQTVLNNGQEPIANAAAQISDAAVQSFLVTMSAENGSLIASAYMAAIIDGMVESGAAEVALAVAVEISDTLAGYLDPDSGFSIGFAFGSAIANGLAMALSALDMSGLSVGGAGSTIGATGVNVGGGISTDGIANAIRDGMNGTVFVLNGEAVGNAVASTVSEHIANESYVRGNR